ncbi:testis-expressed protein 22 isoform X2 [Desmodus rotundus]|uniref:testis-expressed protein 22 isoform X2 n=1 Tax=Desmodus rotundus TaxID=9430 RepID=UPI002380C73B|nr:testis-expressed protein 22 isoform X2 [Desmodus rotundus]
MNSRKRLLTEPPREKPGPQLPQEHRLACPSPGPTDTWGQPRAQSSSQQAPETQDWVCKPPESQYPSRHWSLSIDQRRQRATQGATGVCGHCPVLAQLAANVVDKDVLIPHPRTAAQSTLTGRALLALGMPSSRDVTSEAQASRWPPS